MDRKEWFAVEPDSLFDTGLDQAAGLRMMTKALPKRGEGNTRLRVIAITSGKGGVGKTNIAANLAYILTKMGKKVLIIDADTGLANIDVILGLAPKYNLYHVLTGEKTLLETIIRGPGGILVLPSSSGVQEMTDLSRGQKLTLLDELCTIGPDIDFIIIDTAAGIASNVMYFNMVAGEIIVVTSPEPTSLTDAYALIKVLHRHYGKKRFRLFVNMVKDSAEAKEVYLRLGRATGYFLNLSLEYLGYAPHDEKFKEAIRQQRPLAELYPSSPAARCLSSLAEGLCREKVEDNDWANVGFLRKTL